MENYSEVFCTASPVFIFIICPYVFLYLVTISLIMRKKMRDAFTENRKNVATINQSLESSISGIRVTKAFTNKEKELEKFEKGNLDYVKSR